MKSFCYDYAVIGGDLRQVYLARELAEENLKICCYALCQSIEPPCPVGDNPKTVSCVSLEEACGSSAAIICPIPFSKDGTSLNQNTAGEKIPMNQILSQLKSQQIFFAGNIPDGFQISALRKGVRVFDCMQDITLAYFNSIATAEGVICEAMKNSPKNLHHSKCAVLGYGKCGRTLADYLKRMFCHVTVAAAPKIELAEALLVTDEVMELAEFIRNPGEYDFIFNTIPARVLTKDVLLHLEPSVMILDIASYPGGVDFDAAKELSIKAMSCPGIPGRYAPLSSARAIRECIKRLEKE